MKALKQEREELDFPSVQLAGFALLFAALGPLSPPVFEEAREPPAGAVAAERSAPGVRAPQAEGPAAEGVAQD
jgi:hypothetical protein